MLNDAQRFVRFAIPGLATGVQVLAVAWVAPPADRQTTLSVNAAEAVATVVGGVVALGGLGSVLANLYFGLAWRLPIAVDYRPLLRDVAPLLRFGDRAGREVDVSAVCTRRQA